MEDYASRQYEDDEYVNDVIYNLAEEREMNVKVTVGGSFEEKITTDRVFEEYCDALMKETEFFIGFEKAVEKLRDAYSSCLAQKCTAYNLYPQNPKTTEVEIKIAEILAAKSRSSDELEQLQKNLDEISEATRTPIPKKQLSILRGQDSSSGVCGQMVTISEGKLQRGLRANVTSVSRSDNFGEPTFELLSPDNPIGSRNLVADFNESICRNDVSTVTTNIENKVGVHPQRNRKLTSIKKSPFMIRAVNIVGKSLSETEKTIYDWAVCNGEIPG